MRHEEGQWIIEGASPRDPELIHNCKELEAYVEKVGFLPLFAGDIKGFSVEEHADARYWWSGNTERDPWEWRVQAAQSKVLGYGKFFGGKAGFISKEWLPLFANYRRDGYDFDSLYEEGLARNRAKCIMELFGSGKKLYSYEIKSMAGFGKGGLKNFQGIMTELQMKLYLVVTDFRCRINKRGEEYGMPVAGYELPEDVWGYDLMSSAYSEDPAESFERIVSHICSLYPKADEKSVRDYLK